MTQNNSISMKTVVETYLIEETVELIYDNEKLDKWNEHVQALGLTGQTAIRKPEKSPIPFLHMKTSVVNVFQQLCPRRVNVKAYDKTPIPVEILDLIALSVKEGYFQKIEIWYDDATPDPLCVGLLGDFRVYDKKYKDLAICKTAEEAEGWKDHPDHYNTYFNETASYLIGRWADVKASLEELTAKAKKLFIASKKSEIDKKMKECKRELEDLVNDADQRFGFDDAAISDPLKELPF